jgi:hypothetical protein
MSDLYLELRPTAGSTIAQSCIEAVNTANRLCLTVRFEFNGVTVIAHPDADPLRLAKAFHDALDGVSPAKVAVV